jgi:hypothetical protein
MGNSLHIKNELSGIREVVDLLHDRWLDADSIAFDSEKSVLSIRYLKEKNAAGSLMISRARFPAIECFLRISNVESFSVEDTEKVRFYDVNEIAYDPKSKCIRITTGIPFGIRVFVTDLDLTVEETDAVVQR